MSAFWHPVSAVYLREPWSSASPAVLRLMLASEGSVDCAYAGDRMWPALRHGQTFRLTPLALGEPRAGDVVLAQDGNIVDVMRIAAGADGLRAGCDADPAALVPIDRGRLLGAVSPRPSRVPIPRALARLWLDLVEAVGGGPDPADDPAGTVLGKYDHQAVHYAQNESEPLDPGLREALAGRLRSGARVLVAGSGTGREAFAIEAMGFEASGVDFSPRMVEAARRAGVARASGARFALADLRVHDEPVSSLDAVFFTYDVYSFVPHAEARIRLLARMERWLRPGGCVFLSARRWRGLRALAVLTVQRLRRRAGIAEWGDSHTRWLDGSGRWHRSFIRIFTARQLHREAARAGFRAVTWRPGHVVFERLRTAL